MLNDAIMLLADARQKARNVHERHNGNLKGIAKADETARLFGGVDIKTPGQNHRLVRNNANGAPFNPAKANDDIARMIGLNLKEIAFVDSLADQLMHIIGHRS